VRQVEKVAACKRRWPIREGSRGLEIEASRLLGFHLKNRVVRNVHALSNNNRLLCKRGLQGESGPSYTST